MKKISARFFVGFSITIFVLSVLAALSISYLSQFSGITTEVAQHHAKEIMMYGELQRLLFEMKVDLGAIHRGAGWPQVESYRRHFEDYRRGVGAAVAQQSEFPDSISERVLGVINDSPDRIQSASATLFESARRGEWARVRSEAGQIDRAVIDPLMAECADLIRDEDDQLLSISETIMRRTTAARNTIVLVSSIALALSVVVALWTSISITRPIRALEKASVAIAQGDLTVRSRLESDDETGRLSRAFDHMVDSLEKVLAEQKKFLADTSHNLLTPVTVIQGQLQVMQRSAGQSRASDALDLTYRELGRIKKILNDLVLLAKSSSLQTSSRDPVSVDEFLVEVFREAEVLGERSWHLTAPPRVTMTCDQDLLTSALLELAKNAVQHTRSGDRISISARLENGGVSFDVADTGSGIPGDEQDRIFERFYRGRGTRASTDGSGLGLSIVKAVAEAHEGRVTVKSSTGSGSTFSLWIPLG